jgi:hypothetical protein
LASDLLSTGDDLGDHRINAPSINHLDPSGTDLERDPSVEAWHEVRLALHIHLETALGSHMRVANPMPKTHGATGHLASLCHQKLPVLAKVMAGGYRY